ncbi:pre-rRNA processing protein [Coemansia guatemalensis]|uniref:Pre-rRNA processing protein n=1 Tax=Coemansia guatemalensis TaxID=2761395 RepID=A0A9W8LW05_9FUNG|nr:pre-rRNA processing protein [Coemansia guatemalensis]
MDKGLEQQLQKLREQIGSKAAHQQQHAAMLLAVEETIKEQKADTDPGSYFAALLTLLEQQTGAGGSQSVAGAVIYLLSVILPHVSQTVLRAKFTTMMAVLSQSLDLESAEAALLRSVISCLETVLLAQDASSWRQPIAQATFRSLLQLSTDSKPKIRKRAQEAVSSLLCKPPPPTAIHPAAASVSRFVLDILSNAKADSQAALHTLQLVKQTEMTWPADALGEMCAALIQLSRLNTPFLGILSFQAMETVFSNAGMSLDEEQFRDLLIAIVDLKPKVSDTQSSEAWLKIIQKGYTAYASVGAEACFQSLPDLIELVLPDIEMGKPSTREAATRCIWALIRECIPDSLLESEGVDRVAKVLSSGLSYRYRESWALVFLLLAAMFQRLGAAAHPRMDSIAAEVANMRAEPDFPFKDEADAVLGAALRAVGPQVFLQILPLNVDNGQQPGRAWLLPLMRSHIRNAPLMYFVTEMLPLADNLASRAQQFTEQGREIEAKVFGALSQQVWALFSGFCNVPSDVPEAFAPGLVERLMRELRESTEIRVTICAALQTLLTATHALAQSSNGGGPLGPQQAQMAERHLAQLAPEFLALLFNVFAEAPGAGRGYLMDTITAFLAVVDAREISTTFVKVCAMLDQALQAHRPPPATELTDRYLAAHPPPAAYTMADLAIAMAPRLDAEGARMLLRVATLLARQAEDPALQKKGYKALARLAAQPEDSPARFVISDAMTAQLIPMLVKSAEAVAPGSRRERLALIAMLARSLADDQLHFIPAVVSEAIVATKDANERARTVAFDVLLVMGRRMAQGGVVNMGTVGDDASAGSEQQASMEEFFKMVAAGLAAQTPHMISATVAALSRALFEFHEQLDASFIVELMATVLMFVVHNNREIAKASLGFVKVIAVVLPKEILLSHLAEIVQSILKWSHEYKNQMRLKCRHILDRLGRRLGLDAVASVTPEEHMKLITNMRKTQQRSQRAKEAASAAPATLEKRSAEGSQSKSVAAAAANQGKKSFGSAYEDIIYGSESELDDSDENAAASAKKGKKTRKANHSAATKEAAASSSSSGAWIKEDAEGPLDFLDRAAFTHFSTTDPVAAKSRRSQTMPKTKNGKLVFEDEEVAAKPAAKGAEEGNAGANDEEGEDYYLQSLKSKDGFYRTANQKIKFHKRKAGDDDDMDIASDDNNVQVETASPPKRGKGNNGTPYGREFRSKKAQGDVKRGNIEPYAYIPLNPKTMKGAISVKGGSKRDKRARKVKS